MLQSVDFYVSQPEEMSKYKSCTSYTSPIRLSMALGTGLSVSVSDLDLMTLDFETGCVASTFKTPHFECLMARFLLSLRN